MPAGEVSEGGIEREVPGSGNGRVRSEVELSRNVGAICIGKLQGVDNVQSASGFAMLWRKGCQQGQQSTCSSICMPLRTRHVSWPSTCKAKSKLWIAFSCLKGPEYSAVAAPATSSTSRFVGSLAQATDGSAFCKLARAVCSAQSRGLSGKRSAPWRLQLGVRGGVEGSAVVTKRCRVRQLKI